MRSVHRWLRPLHHNAQIRTLYIVRNVFAVEARIEPRPYGLGSILILREFDAYFQSAIPSLNELLNFFMLLLAIFIALTESSAYFISLTFLLVTGGNIGFKPQINQALFYC